MWRRRWDSNPRTLADNCISSAARYGLFATPPRCYLQPLRHYKQGARSASQCSKRCVRSLAIRLAFWRISISRPVDTCFTAVPGSSGLLREIAFFLKQAEVNEGCADTHPFFVEEEADRSASVLARLTASSTRRCGKDRACRDSDHCLACLKSNGSISGVVLLIIH